MTTSTRFACAHCPESFATAARLGGHVSQAHREHRRANWMPKWLREPAPQRRSGLAKATDVWPGRP